MTPEKILGLPELKKRVYSHEEKKAIRKCLSEFAACKNENYTNHVVNTWIEEFENLQMPVLEVIKRIRLAKQEPKFGVTEFAVFMNVNLSDYAEFFEHKKKEIEAPETKGFGKAIPLFNKWIGLKKPEYIILDELKPDKDSEYGYILIQNDLNYTVFYSKEHFKLIQ